MHVPSLLMGIGSIVAGASALQTAFRGGPHHSKQQLRGLGDHPVALSFNEEPKGKIYQVRNIDERLKGVMIQMNKSARDPWVRMVSAQVVSRRCRKPNDQTGDGGWCVDEKDYWGEVRALFNWMRANVRYVRDIHGVDLFQSARRTIESRSGDCFTGDSLVVTPDGLRPIADLNVGDRIHDGRDWVDVEKTWDKGDLQVLQFELNNGCVLRCTPGHHLLRVTKVNGETVFDEIEAHEAKPGDDLVQPREFNAGTVRLSEAHAVILGAYIAEGWRQDYRFSIAGIADSKGLRERVIKAASDLGLDTRVTAKEISFRSSDLHLIEGCGTRASNKRLPHLNFDLDTVRVIVSAMEQGDGGVSSSGTNMVYSTISKELATQYRVMKRMLGFSTSIIRVDDHGGLGSHPIYRVTVRESNQRRPWAKIRSISDGGTDRCFDIKTSTGVVYLPESDVRVRQCDDYNIALGSMLMTLGYPVRSKTIQTKDSDDWNHIYLQVGLPPGNPTQWKTLDASVPRPAGWEASKSMIARSRLDYPTDTKLR